MTELVDPAELVGFKDIADGFGVSHTAVQFWAMEDGFPEPVAVIGKRTRIWVLSAIREWHENRPPGRVAVHGGSGALYNRGCRCDRCRAAHAERMTNLTNRRTQRLAEDPTLAPHGSASTYKNWGCRCAPCSEAHSEMCRVAHVKRKARRD